MTNTLIAEKERLATLTTSAPFALYETAGNLVNVMEAFKIKMEVVFNGIPIKRDISLLHNKQRERPRSILDLHGRVEDSIRLFDEQRTRNVLNEISSTLNEDGEDYLFLFLKLYNRSHESGQNGSLMTTRAPYWSWAQLASYLAPTNKYLDEVFGCLEMLAFEMLSA